MRALLDLLRENVAAGKDVSDVSVLLFAECSKLKILDPEHGDEELIKLVASALAEILLLRQSGSLMLCITHTSVLTPTSPLKR